MSTRIKVYLPNFIMLHKKMVMTVIILKHWPYSLKYSKRFGIIYVGT